jgi:hypothetical protein
MCCDFPARIFICGGKACSIVKDFFGSIGLFCGFLINPFADTSLGGVLTLSGKPLANLQSILILNFWFLVLSSIINVIAACTGVSVIVALLTPADQSNTSSTPLGVTNTTLTSWGFTTSSPLSAPVPSQYANQVADMLNKAIVLWTVAFAIFGMISAYANWFGSIKRRGVSCFMTPVCCICVCIEGYFILYYLGFMCFVTALFNIMGLSTAVKIGGWFGWTLFASSILVTVIYFYAGIYFCKVAGLTDEEHDHDLEALSDDDSS